MPDRPLPEGRGASVTCRGPTARGARRTSHGQPQVPWELIMSADQEGGALSAGRQQALDGPFERQVMQRTGGRIRALEVKVSHDLVIVRGRAPSYYVEQLALQGVLDLIESSGTMRIELNIQVASPRSGPERHSSRGSPPETA